MKKRVFVAIGIEEELQKKIIIWQKKFSQLPVRWIKTKNLHITLVPPWYCIDIDGVINSLRSIKNMQPFTIVFQKVSFGPNPKKPRLIWITGDTKDELKILQLKLTKILGVKGESREFLLHMTIARFRTVDFSKFSTRRLPDKVSWKETVNSVLVMESQMAKSGTEYKTIAEIPLLLR